MSSSDSTSVESAGAAEGSSNPPAAVKAKMVPSIGKYLGFMVVPPLWL
jgi:hypothetical protein